MRWRTEKEVVDGKGQFSCGEVNCTSTNLQFKRDLCSYEVPFSYVSRDGKKNTTLVKVRLCGSCALKLYYRKIHDYEAMDSSRRERRKRCETSKDVFDYINEVLHDGEEEMPPPPPLAPPPPSQQQQQQHSSPSATIPTSLSTTSTQPSDLRSKSSHIRDEENSSHRSESKAKRQKVKTKGKKKSKSANDRCHYSSSSEYEYEYEYGSESEEQLSSVTTKSRPNKDREQSSAKEYDANGNEVISTSNDIWKTSVEVEHTETEKMDDFINQLFM